MEIRKVSSKKDLMRFITFPHQLYKRDKNYVPALNMATKRMLGKKNPFLQHSEIALFIALKRGVVVGRIAAIYNQTHLDTYRDHTGFFGFFDAINDLSVAKSLFEACEQWLKKKDIRRMIGPANLTTNDSCGMLTEGFQDSPMVLMPYNKEYYNRLCSQLGFAKLIDLNSYSIPVNGSKLGNYDHIYQKGLEAMELNRINIRNLSPKTFRKDTEQLRWVYNKVNENNWGFMPLNEAEFKEMASDLKMATPWDLTLVIEKEGQVIGFLIAVPDLNQALRFVKSGTLFPLGIFRFLHKKRGIHSARILILGVLDEYKGMGLDVVMYRRIKEAFDKRHIVNSEACYVLESNQPMNLILNKISEGIAKKYRMYEKQIES